MSQRFSFQNLNLKSRGFSLVELMMTVGILGILSLGSASIMTQAFQSQQKGQSDASAQSTTRVFGQMLQKKKLDTGATVACTQLLQFDNAINTQFNNAGKTDVTLNAPNSTPLRSGSVVTGGGRFTIQRLYLDDVVLANDLGAQKLYVASLYVTTKTSSTGVDFFNRPRQIATMTLTVDSTSKALLDCNAETAVDAKAMCTGVDGLKWNQATMKCDQAVTTDPATFQIQCMPGFEKKSDGVCRPIPSTCASGQLAKGYNFSEVTGCSLPPIPVVAPILPNAVVPLPNDPVVPAQPAAPAVVYSPPAVPAAPQSQPLPPASAASRPAPACANGVSLGSGTYGYCFGAGGINGVQADGAYCQPQTTPPPVADNSCIARAPAAYISPAAAPAAAPAPSAPADNTCQCAARRINNLDYCMFCVQNVNFGFGNVDYASGVSQCQAGNLVPVPGHLDTSGGAPFCNNGYGRATGINGRFKQFRESMR